MRLQVEKGTYVAQEAESEEIQLIFPADVSNLIYIKVVTLQVPEAI